MKKNQSVFLIFICWLIYAISYLGKVNYSANITQIIDFYGIGKSEAGLPPTFFFFAYGIGQVVNGLLSNELKANLGLEGTGQEVSFMKSTLSYPGILVLSQEGPSINLSPKDDILQQPFPVLLCYCQVRTYHLHSPS